MLRISFVSFTINKSRHTSEYSLMYLIHHEQILMQHSVQLNKYNLLALKLKFFTTRILFKECHTNVHYEESMNALYYNYRKTHRSSLLSYLMKYIFSWQSFHFMQHSRQIFSFCIFVKNISITIYVIKNLWHFFLLY